MPSSKIQLVKIEAALNWGISPMWLVKFCTFKLRRCSQPPGGSLVVPLTESKKIVFRVGASNSCNYRPSGRKSIMKKYILLFSIPFLLAGLFSCRSSKPYLERSNEYKALLDAVAQLSKNTSDEKALEAVPVLYKQVQENKLKQIKDLSASPDLGKFDKTLLLYNELQDAYQAIISTPSAFRLLSPVSYSSQIFETQQEAAESYYLAGKQELNKGSREASKKAFTYFGKAEKFVTNYKDARALKEQAYENALINVVINPVRDNSYFSNQTWSNGLSYSNDYFQRSLVRDLNALNRNYYPSAFYTDWDARSQNIRPDWAVDLVMRNIIMPYNPSDYRYKRDRSAQIEIGKDTAGRPVYRTVYATLNITRSTMIARAEMEVRIDDLNNNQSIRRRTFQEEYRWQSERATYSGDSRALSASDWELINNVYHQPQRDYLLEELYKKIYPQVKSYLTNSVSW